MSYPEWGRYGRRGEGVHVRAIPGRRLPKPYRFDCEKVEITRQGDAVVLRPQRANPWANVEAALAEFDAAAPFGFDREQLPPQERPELDALFE